MLALLLSAIFYLSGFSSGCFSAFKNTQNITFVQLDCANSAGFNATPTTEELLSDGFDDKVNLYTQYSN